MADSTTPAPACTRSAAPDRAHAATAAAEPTICARHELVSGAYERFVAPDPLADDLRSELPVGEPPSVLDAPDPCLDPDARFEQARMTSFAPSSETFTDA